MNLEQFKELFNPLPGDHYLQVCENEDKITEVLKAFLDKVDGELSIALYNDENLNLTQPFRARPRDNDIDIIDGYDLLMDKKMYMWGNGL